MMDSDGFNHRYVNARRHDRADPAAVAQGRQRLAYVSYPGGIPQVRVLDLGSRRAAARWSPATAMSFAPRYSPDGAGSSSR